MSRIHFTRQQLRESLERVALREQVRKIVERELMEEIGRTISNRILTEAEDDDKQPSETNDTKRKRVMAWLKSPLIDHAQVAYEIYHPQDKADEDRYRSEFSKKVNGTPDAEGHVRKFSNKEIDALNNVMQKSKMSK